MRRRLINRFLRGKGLTIAPLNGPSLAGAFERLRARGIPVATVIDVGASDGCWSAALMPMYPAAHYLCIEAQPGHEPALRAFQAKHPNVQYVLAAAGEREGTVHFDATDLFGGVASYNKLAEKSIVAPVTTVDLEVARRGLAPPFLLKLDTHGFELPILAGAQRTLAQTAVLIVEVYNFRISPTAVLFPELCQHLAAAGFRCLDLFDPLYRPGDNAFWQMDLLFVRADRPEFQRDSYQ